MEKYCHALLTFSFISNTFLFLPLFLNQFYVTAVEIDTSCAPFNCGHFINISYSFWNFNTQPDYCGHTKFKLNCENDHLTIKMKSQTFRILYLNQTSQVLRMARVDIYDLDATHKSYCPKNYANVDIDSHFFKYTSNNENYTALYECSPLIDNLIFEISDAFSCLIGDTTYTVYVVSNAKLANFIVLKCKNRIMIPGIKNSLVNNSEIATSILYNGFEVEWSGVGEDKCHACTKSDGICGFKKSENTFTCLSKRSLPDAVVAGKWNLKKKFTIGLVSVVLATLIVIVAIYIYLRQHNNNYEESSTTLPTHLPVEESQIIQMNRIFGTQHFTYEELEAATYDFSNQIGEGAGGDVFGGQLLDGRHIAVKKIHDHCRHQFMNELQTLGNLAHPNLVSLYGSTSPGSGILMLVYEYVSNGTISDHLQFSGETDGYLPWSIRINIAVETASALKYLHSCNIIHRDIKSSNILLDANFHVKVADFGISRLLPTDQSHVTTNPQGTPGYIAPEYRQYNELTLKSDVFNFGVVLLQLVTSMCPYDISRPVRNLHVMALERIQNQTMHKLVDSMLGYDLDSNIEQMINRVIELAGRCLHESRDARPDMDEVFISLQEIQQLGENEM